MKVVNTPNFLKLISQLKIKVARYHLNIKLDSISIYGVCYSVVHIYC